MNSTTRAHNRLTCRVENAIQFRGHQEFTAAQVAAALGVDKYDVLHVLHVLKVERKVEAVPVPLHLMQETKWRLVKDGAAYVYRHVEARPVGDAL